jgi:hypothetical protein
MKTKKVEKVVIVVMLIVAAVTVLYFNNVSANLPPMPDPTPLPRITPPPWCPATYMPLVLVG